MLQSLSHLSALPSLMCSGSHPLARRAVPLSSFQGKEKEGEDCRDLLGTPHTHLVTQHLSGHTKNKLPPCFSPFRSFSAPSPSRPGCRDPEVKVWAVSSLAAGPFHEVALCFQHLFPSLPAQDIYREQCHNVLDFTVKEA